MDTLDRVIKFSKALIIFSIAIFFVRCSLGHLTPEFEIHGLENGDTILIEIQEEGKNKTITLRKNEKDLLIVEGMATDSE